MESLINEEPIYVGDLVRFNGNIESAEQPDKEYIRNRLKIGKQK